MKLYHGTTYEACLKIMQNGFSTTYRNWKVSKDEVYFWNETESRTSEECVRKAYDLAVIAAACQNSKSDKVCVIVIDYDIPTHKDESCENSTEERVAAYVGNVNEIINKYKTKVSIQYFKYHPELRAKYLYNDFSLNSSRWKWLNESIKDYDELLNQLNGLKVSNNYAKTIQTTELSFENNIL